jgi:hypothetical protein
VEPAPVVSRGVGREWEAAKPLRVVWGYPGQGHG